METNENCIFCKIVEGTGNGHIIFYNKTFCAFLDAYPASEGHTLVVPKRHVQDIRSLTGKELTEIMLFSKKYTKAIFDNLEVTGVNILTSNGEGAQQEIPHFHVHIIPRYKNDGINFHYDHKKSSTDFEKVEMKMKKIISKIDFS